MRREWIPGGVKSENTTTKRDIKKRMKVRCKIGKFMKQKKNSVGLQPTKQTKPRLVVGGGG